MRCGGATGRGQRRWRDAGHVHVGGGAGQRRAQQRKGVIAIKQSNAEISDSIVAEDIGKLPDNSVAAALQRVTGMQVARAGGEVGRCWCAARQSSSRPWFAEATHLLGITASDYFGQRPGDFPREIASPERTCTLGVRFRL
ncbi:hypothetical protein AC801_10700 [Xanthomonas sp. ISO98C4]|nr:hypothetical protein AC801_10700 [Xanthomonas sp. ISO98C4]